LKRHAFSRRHSVLLSFVDDSHDPLLLSEGEIASDNDFSDGEVHWSSRRSAGHDVHKRKYEPPLSTASISLEEGELHPQVIAVHVSRALFLFTPWGLTCFVS
jgi:hypothetical protein